MTEKTPELSPGLSALSAAIRQHETPPRVVFCGFDLWLEVMGSGFLTMRDFRKGGTFADGTEPETTLIVPIPVLGNQIVVNFDPTLPPDQFRLKA